MNMRQKIYKGHRLVALKEAGGWRVRMGNAGLKSDLHLEPNAAFAQAEKWVDAYLLSI